MHAANDEQSHLAKYIKEFKIKTKPQNNSNLKKVKKDTINSAMALLRGREMVFKAFESGIFSKLKESEHSSDQNDMDNTDNTLLTPIQKRNRT